MDELVALFVFLVDGQRLGQEEEKKVRTDLCGDLAIEISKDGRVGTNEQESAVSKKVGLLDGSERLTQDGTPHQCHHGSRIVGV
jgi:hypothetical protein